MIPRYQTMLLDKLEKQAQEIGRLENQNERLQTALSNLSHQKTVTHKRMPKKNPFRVLKGGRA